MRTRIRITHTMTDAGKFTKKLLFEEGRVISQNHLFFSSALALRPQNVLTDFIWEKMT